MLRRYEHDLKAVNNLFGGGFPLSALVGVTGAPKAGKTIFTIQTAYDYMVKEKKNVLFVDTEGTLASDYIPLWGERFEKRYDISPKYFFAMGRVETYTPPRARKPRRRFRLDWFDGKKPTGDYPQIISLTAVDIQSFSLLFGRPLVVTYSKSGKVTVLVDPAVVGEDNLIFSPVEDTPIGRFVAENNIGMVVVDSITMLTTPFAGGRVSFPARADALGLLLSTIIELAEKMGITVVATHHESLDPANPYARPTVKGGKMIRHTFKYNMYIEALRGKKNAGVKRLYLERHPTEEPFAFYTSVMLKSDGYHDLNPDRVYKTENATKANVSSEDLDGAFE